MASTTAVDTPNSIRDSSTERADSAKDLQHAPKQARLRQGPDELCKHCHALKISPRSFIVSDQDALPQQQKTSALRTGMGDIQLPSYQDIVKTADTCRLCKLIVKAIGKYGTRLDTLQEITCSLRWEVDGRREVASDAFQNRTRRLRLSWCSEGARKSEAFLILVAQTPAGLPHSDAAHMRGRAQTFRGREVQRGQGKQALIKSWLDICRKEHKNACGIATQRCEFERLVNETYFGVIDVTDLQLKPLPRDQKGRPAKFVALSYVWGTPDKPYITTRLNVPFRRQHGGLEKDLKDFPTVIKDAITLVQKLNLRYLWVDALCIVQDSSASWRLNAADMHVIYGNAHFTICAADGSGAETGLLAMETDIEEDLIPRDSEEIMPGLRLQIARPPEMVIQGSKWNSRGWTYQERILSRRCVIFADGRAYFQCRKTAFSEDVHNDAKGSGWSLQAMGAPLRYFIEIEMRCFAFYMKSACMYYNRSLTHPGDILAAYKGIQSVMELVMYAPFSFGLPTSHFDLALLWQPKRSIRRRTIHGQEFPSWSWCGWEGGDIDYVSATLEGALVSVREWLSNHTWIRWHILDGRGQLRPLWHMNRVFEDNSREHRWRGYVGLPTTANEAMPSYDGSSSEDTEDFTKSRVGMAREGYNRERHDYSNVHHYDEWPEYKLDVYANYTPEPYAFPRPRDRFSKPEPGYGFLQRDGKAVVQNRVEVPTEDLAELMLKIAQDDIRRNRSRRRSRSRGRSSSRRRSRSRHYDASLSDTSDDSSRVRAQLSKLNEAIHRVRFANRHSSPTFTEVNLAPLPPLVPHLGLRARQEGIYGRDKIRVPHEQQLLDSWGREYGAFCKDDRYLHDEFTRTHPENPYRVKKTEWTKPDTSMGSQDLPILQFWTMSKRLRVLVDVKAADTAEKDSGLVRCHIGDTSDDWCGSVLVDREWSEKNNGKLVTFIALSEAKSFTEEEGRNWNYYTPRERNESEWELFYALLIELNEEKHVWERVGLAKIFKGAFSGDCWREIMLG